jgi:hypothetical protein
VKHRWAAPAALACFLVPVALSSAATSAPSAAPQSYHPRLTAWGDPDLRATWTMGRIVEAGIPLERPPAMGNRAWLTDAEFAQRLAEAKKSDAGYQQDIDANGTAGLAAWIAATPFARRSSLIVSPANGRLPPMTPAGEALFKGGRNSWVAGQPIDWLADLDTYDRCITRGVPSAILPWPNSDVIRVLPWAVYVVIQTLLLGTRIVPVGHGERAPANVRSWGGYSLGHWAGSTLVIETTNIVAGDSVSGDLAKRAGSPITGRGHGVVPMSGKARTLERLTMTGPNTLLYRVTYSDPDVFTAPWTAEVEWTRDDKYQMYEYACHEGNEVRELIASSRAQREREAAAGMAGHVARK